ncbi:MAG: replicative DNA helicase [Parvibaculaceae bacterium]
MDDLAFPPDEPGATGAPDAGPRNVELEQVLLSCFLHENSMVTKCADFLEPEHFYEGLHARIWHAMRVEVDQGRPFNTLSMISLFSDDATIKEVGGAAAYFSHLAASCITVVNAPFWARNIRELAQRRRVLDVARHLQDRAASSMLDPLDDIGGEAIDLIANGAAISEDRLRRSRHDFGEAAEKMLAAVNDARIGGKPTIGVIPTGIHDLDQRIGDGLRRKETSVIAGRTSMGKTHFAVALALAMAKRQHGVLYFSLEMSTEALMARALSNLSYVSGMPGIPYSRIPRQNGLTDREMERLLEAGGRFKALPFVIEDRPGLTVASVRNVSKVVKEQMAAKGQRLDAVLIDHIGKIKAGDRYAGNKVAETGEVSQACAALAKDMDCAVLPLVQVSRGTEGRENKRPTLADLRWSSDVEADADNVFALYREAYYLEREMDGAPETEQLDLQDRLRACERLMEVLVLKNRQGPIGTVKTFCDVACNVVSDWCPA